MRKCLICTLLLLFLLSGYGCARGDFTFEDRRFMNSFTTENLNRILDEYELHDGWYWTAMAFTDQTFHGHPDKPGWTDSSRKIRARMMHVNGWYGCRWGVDQISAYTPDGGGYGECFGFAQFIGYLLSGDPNPQGHWNFFYSMEKAGGLRVGDIVRTEYTRLGREYHHSAVVYSIYGDEVRFLYVSGSDYNRICVDEGFSDGFFRDVVYQDEIARLPWLKISRAPQNCD